MKVCLLFDWTGTLVNEFKLDKNICKKMEHEISKKKKFQGKRQKKIIKLFYKNMRAHGNGMIILYIVKYLELIGKVFRCLNFQI